MDIEQARQALCDLDRNGDGQLLLSERLRGEIVGAISRTINELADTRRRVVETEPNKFQRDLLELMRQVCKGGELVYDDELTQSGRIVNSPIEIAVRVNAWPEPVNTYNACGSILRALHKLANDDT